MGNVVISPNIQRESARIDPAGNIINPRNKQIIKPVEPEPVISAPVIPPPIVEPTPNTMSDKINKMVEDKIAERVSAIVEARVNEALKNL